MTTEYILPFVFITLIIIVIIQAVERYFFAEQVQRDRNKILEEMSRLVKAVIAKNANDYVMTASIDKVAPEEKIPLDPELVPEDQLTDEEFDQAIGKQLKAKK